MAREALITTPENIALEYELAGLGTRFSANLVDTILQLIIVLTISLAGLLLGLLLTYVGAHEHWKALVYLMSQLSKFIEAAILILTFVVFWGYYIFFEYKWNGQTPGKRYVGLRVIREGGYPVDMYSVILRNLLRIVDFFPMLYSLGIISILITDNYQRLGDVLAGTIVVKQRAPGNLINLLQSTRLQPEHLDQEALALMQREADHLTPNEYKAVRHFTERRRSLSNWGAQQEAARTLAVPLMQRLRIVPPAGVSAVNYADVLEYLAVAYENARRPKDARISDPKPNSEKPSTQMPHPYVAANPTGVNVKL